MSDQGRRTRPASRPRISLHVLAIPVFLAVAVFANTLGNDFVYDDRPTLDTIQAMSQTPRWSWTGRGLTYVLHRADLALWGNWGPGFHLTNIVLHSLAVLLAAIATFRITSSNGYALLCAALFAVHPVHVEAVASFAYRKDILATVFVLIALIFWLGSSRSWVKYLGTLTAVGCALLSKEVAAVGIIPMLGLVDGLEIGEKDTRRRNLFWFLARTLPIAAIGAAAVVFFLGSVGEVFTGRSIEQIVDPRLHDYGQVFATMLGSNFEVARLLVFPRTLSADYATTIERSVLHARPLLGVALVTLWVVVGASMTRRRPIITFAMAWVLVFYAPCSNLVPLTKFFVAERYLYAPSYGICLVAAILIVDWIERAAGVTLRWRAGAAMLLIGVLGARCVVRNRDWADDRTLWSSALRTGADTYRVHTNLGSALSREGRYEEAVQEFRAGVRLNPAGHSNLALALFNLGSIEEGLVEQRAALRFAPGDAKVRVALAAGLTKKGRLDEAVHEYREVLRIDPDHAEVHGALGVVLARQGDLGASLTEFEEAIRLQPDHADQYINMGNALRGMHRYAEAIQTYRKGLALGEFDDALNSLAWILVTCPDPSLKDAREALRLARRACQLSKYGKPIYMVTLAVAEAETGGVVTAAKIAQEGAVLARSRGEADVALYLDKLARNLGSGRDWTTN